MRVMTDEEWQKVMGTINLLTTFCQLQNRQSLKKGCEEAREILRRVNAEGSAGPKKRPVRR